MKYNLHDILSISSHGEGVVPDAFRYENFRGSVNLEIQSIKKNEFNKNSESREISPGIFVSEKEKKIIARFKIIGLRISISMQFLEDRIVVCYSPSYRFVSDYILKMPIASLYPFEHFLKLIIQMCLLEKNVSYFIAAGVMTNNETILISSFGGIGKTTTCLKLLESFPEWKFLGDDTLMTNGDAVFSYPKDLRIRKFGNAFLSYNKNVSVEKYFKGKNQIIKDAMPKKIFFLERGVGDKAYQISSREAVSRYKAISKKILAITSERILLSAYYQGYIDLAKLEKIQDDIAEKLINKLDCFVVESSNGGNFSNLISEIVDKK